ncbi:MAG: sulfite exporter TauE/SafE family protein [Clostridia bacterium]|nr:sulfite exporter TauE/SafE family protein [Clostridia bacterium]
MKKSRGEKTERKGRGRLYHLIAPGLLAGGINGLFGCGGGIITMLVLSRYLSGDRGDKERTRRIFASTVLSVIPMSLGSAIVYGTLGAVESEDVLPLILPALLGGMAGALLLSRINTGLLKKIFSALVIWSGIRLMM